VNLRSPTQRLLLAGVVLMTVLAGVFRYTHINEIIAFIIAGVALAGLAWIVSDTTEVVGLRLGPAVTGTLHSTVGNLPEFFVVIFALQAGDRVVAETALLGSILVNALLVLGIVLIIGALRSRDGTMRFDSRLPNDTATLLLVSSFLIILLGLAHGLGGDAVRHAKTISVVGAVAIILVYAAWMRQFLAGAGGPAGAAGSDADPPDATADAAAQSSAATRAAPSLVLNVVLLVAAGTASAFTSDWFVHALEPTIRQVHLSQTFAGLVIVAIAGNAVENIAGIVQAYRGYNDLAISIVKSSVAQIAAFMWPALVIISLALKSQLTFQLAPIFIGALVATAILVWQITGDGEATVFEGAALVATFVVLATVAIYEH
jgi:Ca2+:H+ antiporter